jgi:hypothetical protein
MGKLSHVGRIMFGDIARPTRAHSTTWMTPTLARRAGSDRVRSAPTCALLVCLVSVLPLFIACVSAGSSSATAQASPGPIAPNESSVTADVTDVQVVDSATLGMQPPQPLSVLTLRLLSVRTSGDLPPAVPATEKTVHAYTKDPDLTRLKGTTVTAVLTMQGDDRLWLVRLEKQEGPK